MKLDAGDSLPPTEIGRISRPAIPAVSDETAPARPATQAHPPRLAATDTLRLSVIIPTINEEAHLARTLRRATASPVEEVVVVDGGSRDRTREIAASFGARVIMAEPGRARQMNAGAAAATGGALLFLHADTQLPDAFPQIVAGVLSRPGVSAGAFRLQIESGRRSLRLVESLVALRGWAFGMPYGDQALFLMAATFRQVGGFPDVPVMEDFELIRRLRRLGRVRIARAAVTTSARRWLRHGVVRTTLLNQACVAARLAGISPDRIASWRRMPGPKAPPGRSRSR
ncbi:MAG: TIGR04283 family arsenosugar biosynthesis glycosyltransferase [Phycisphaerae bacterium]